MSPWPCLAFAVTRGRRPLPRLVVVLAFPWSRGARCVSPSSSPRRLALRVVSRSRVFVTVASSLARRPHRSLTPRTLSSRVHSPSSVSRARPLPRPLLLFLLARLPVAIAADTDRAPRVLGLSLRTIPLLSPLPILSLSPSSLLHSVTAFSCPRRTLASDDPLYRLIFSTLSLRRARLPKQRHSPRCSTPRRRSVSQAPHLPSLRSLPMAGRRPPSAAPALHADVSGSLLPAASSTWRPISSRQSSS